MIPVNFSQLYYFWVIAKSGGVSAAAKILLLNQSTLSTQLKQLETALGRRLLLRSSRGVSMTEEGRMAFGYCERVFPHLEEMVSRLRSGAPPAPILRLGVSRFVSREKVLGAAAFLKSCARKAVVKVVSGTPGEVEEMLRRRTVDLALSDVDSSQNLGRDYRARLAGSFPHYFVASPRLKAGLRRFPDILRHAPLMLRCPENSLRKGVDHFLRGNGIVPNIVMEADNPDIILSMVLDRDGIGVLDYYTIHRYLRQKRIVQLHARPIGIRENLWLMCCRHPHADPEAQAAIERFMADFKFSHQRLD